MSGGVKRDGAEQRPALVISAHRSYRRLQRISGRTLIQTMILLVIVELALLRSANWLTALVGRVALALVPPLHPPVALVTTSYLGVRIRVLSFVLPSSTYPVKLIWFAGAAIVLVTVLVVKRIPIPVRVAGGFAAVLVGVSAYYVMVIGEPGFDGYQVSALYIRTALLVWLLLPILLTVSSIALPFTLLERLALPIVCVAIDVVFAMVRYAFFVWILGMAGPIPMPMLYLLFGPAFDFISVVAISSVALVHLSHRLNRTNTSEAWLWT